MDLRKVALITFVLSLAGAIVPIWNDLSRMYGLATVSRQWWVLPLLPLMICFTVLMPAFYFALFRNPGPMHFPHSLRKLALLAAAACVAVVLVRVGKTGNITWSATLAFLGDASYILLLVTMSRDVADEPGGETPPSTLLVRVTQTAVLVWGAWLVFQLVRIAWIVGTYSQLEQVAFQFHRTPPTLREMVTEVVLTCLLGAGLLAAPFIVWRSGFGRGESTSTGPA